STTNHLWPNHMVPLQLDHPTDNRPPLYASSHAAMMTRRSPRKHLPGPPHPNCPKGPTIRNNPFHYIRGLLLPRILLSLLPLKPSPNTRTGGPMAPNRSQTPKPP